MFTVEFESDASIITSLDETGEMNDIEMIVSESDKVYVRQWDEDLEKYEMIIMTYQQLLDIISSLQQTEGMFQIIQKG
jgi:translation initiation factor IF-1|tara:strand:- start:895 stop:1128 length:234 start_codon:yes stop_codon:yes gene_type:complete